MAPVLFPSEAFLLAHHGDGQVRSRMKFCTLFQKYCSALQKSNDDEAAPRNGFVGVATIDILA